MSGLTTIDEDTARRRLPSILSGFGIKADFPVSLLGQSESAYGTSYAESRPIYSDGKITEWQIAYTFPLCAEVVPFEVGHLKLRCMPIVSFEPLQRLPPWAILLHAMHDEFYDYLLVGRADPTLARILKEDQVSNIPPLGAIESQAASLPPAFDDRWWDMGRSLMRTALNSAVCLSLPGLGALRGGFGNVLNLFRNTSFASPITDALAALCSLPPLPAEGRGFSEEDNQLIIRCVERIVQSYTGRPDAPTFPRKAYSIECTRSDP